MIFTLYGQAISDRVPRNKISFLLPERKAGILALLLTFTLLRHLTLLLSVIERAPNPLNIYGTRGATTAKTDAWSST